MTNLACQRELNKTASGDWDANLTLPVSLDNATEHNLFPLLQDIIRQRNLIALFQPIINISDASIFGHEGLIRGPANCQLHAPLDLFAAARAHDVSVEIDHLSRQIVLESFVRSASSYKLFLNVSPECFMQPNAVQGAMRAYIHQLGLDPHNVVIELTESSPTFDYDLLRKAAEHYHNMGFEIAMDDLGEGFSSLRLWSELCPDYVKIDKHFIRDINTDQVKLEFVRSIQQIAQNSGAKVIAEGIETQAELVIIKDLNIPFGQGYLLGRPQPQLLRELSPDLDTILRKNVISVYAGTTATLRQRGNIIKLLKYMEPLTPETSNDEVWAMFESNPTVYSLPVVAQKTPVGLISRYSMIDHFARPYRRELYGKKPCDIFMDVHPLIVEKSINLHELSDLITHMEPHHLSNGFIVTDSGNYLGMGSGPALLKEITQMQIKAARYANPLTMLPGNVPISEHMDRLLERGITFWACYCDLDNFKPFNDAYGFRRGDELIQFTGKLLSSVVVNEIDFVGHIGGDDFILIFQSTDWEPRCVKILDSLKQAMPDFYDVEDRMNDGIVSEDRQGKKICYPLVSMSIGVVKVEPAMYASHHEVSSAIASAKKQAKGVTGNSLFLERRTQAMSSQRLQSVRAPAAV